MKKSRRTALGLGLAAGLFTGTGCEVKNADTQEIYSVMRAVNTVEITDGQTISMPMYTDGQRNDDFWWKATNNGGSVTLELVKYDPSGNELVVYQTVEPATQKLGYLALATEPSASMKKDLGIQEPTSNVLTFRDDNGDHVTETPFIDEVRAYALTGGTPILPKSATHPNGFTGYALELTDFNKNGVPELTRWEYATSDERGLQTITSDN